MPGETEMTPTAPAAGQDDDDVEAQVTTGGDGEEDEEEMKKRQAEHTLWTRIWIGIAAVCIAFEVLAMVLSGGNTAVLVAGIIGIVVALGVVKFQCDLQDTDCKFYNLFFSWFASGCCFKQNERLNGTTFIIFSFYDLTFLCFFHRSTSLSVQSSCALGLSANLMVLLLTLC